MGRRRAATSMQDTAPMNRDVLGRPLTPAEVLHFSHTARRIAAILRLVGGG